jgi:hypothetical protein
VALTRVVAVVTSLAGSTNGSPVRQALQPNGVAVELVYGA